MWRSTRFTAWAVAAVVAGTSFPVAAGVPTALMLRKKKKRRRAKKPADAVTPADAAAARAPAQARGRALMGQGESTSAGIEFDNAAAQLGDPVLYLDAGDAYYGGAEEERDPELARAAIERGRIALDVLYFHLDSGADRYFRLVEPGEVPRLIVRAQELIEKAEALIAEIEAEAAEPEEEEPKPRKKVGRDKALLISGAALTSVGIIFAGLGVAGLGLGYSRQLDAQSPTVYGDEYDAVAARGKRANNLAYAGLPLAAVFLATGIALIVVAKRGTKGKKKKKPKDEKLTFSPALGPSGSGVTLSGRF